MVPNGLEIGEGGQGGGFGPTEGIIDAVEVIVGPKDEDQDENQEEGNQKAHDDLPTGSVVWGKRDAILVPRPPASQGPASGQAIMLEVSIR